MSLTFKEIVDAVLADSFDEKKRADAKKWVSFRHAWLWDLEDWTFRRGTSTVTFTAASQTLSGTPSDLHAVIALYDTNGNPVVGISDLREFFDAANPAVATSTGTPTFYTVVDGSILTDTLGDGSSGTVVYEKSKPSLVNDTDTTGLPDGYDVALVHGGKAEGFKLTNIPLWQGFDDDFTAAANALRRSYLSQVRETGQQWGAYHPDRVR